MQARRNLMLQRMYRSRGAGLNPNHSRAATIRRCTGEPRYFLSRYEYRYLNGISLYRKTTKYFSSKMTNYFTNIQKLLYKPFFSHFCFQSRIFQCVVSISCQLTQSYAPATKTRGSFVTLVLSSKCLPVTTGTVLL